VTLLAVILGGACGAPARFALERAVTARAGHRFPWGTLLVNLTGSFALGVIVGVSLNPLPHAAVATGFLGAYTTYSAFAYESTRLHADGARARAIAYVVVTTVLGTALAWLGLLTG
jgi:CrcB protein